MKRISFKIPLVRAIMAGTKTETRRLLNPQPMATHCHPNSLTPIRDTTRCDGTGTINFSWVDPVEGQCVLRDGGYRMRWKPAYQVGDIIGVAEPWFMQNSLNAYSGKELVAMGWQSPMFYADYLSESDLPILRGRYRQARFLPDAFVRTRLRILSVEAQRLQEITELDAQHEGVEGTICFPKGSAPGDGRTGWTVYLPKFKEIWDSIHGQPSRDSKGNVLPAQPWASNPWVFRYCFEVYAQ